VSDVQENGKSVSNESSVPETIVKRLRSWLRINLRIRNNDNSLKEALEEVIEEHEEDGGESLPQEEQDMLKKVLNFGDLSVHDIMTPRMDIKAVEYSTSLEDLKTHVIEYRHTRVPVYNDTLDNVKGFIHIKDLMPLLSGDHPFNMALVLRDMLFVPPSMKLTTLIVKMRTAGVHMAIVIDEYGGTDGLVTLEDMFEEIVGEIPDEHDEDELGEPLTWTEQGFCDADARIRVERLDTDLGLTFEHAEGEADYDTLGGLIFYQLGHVPVEGETIAHRNGVRFEILEADPRRIKKVRVFRPDINQEKAIV